MHTPRGCVYCTSTEHRAVNCTKVTDVSQRKSNLASKRLCFNNVRAHTEQHYARAKHLVTLAKENITHQSVKNCKCYCRHATRHDHNHVGESAVIHPVVVVRVEGYKFRALLDSGASHSYCSSTFVKLVKAQSNAASLRQIAMLMGVTTKTL